MAGKKIDGGRREALKVGVFMGLAASLAWVSTCRRLRVGAVVVSSDMNEVLAVGYNGPPAGVPNGSCRGETPCGCVHAEANALVKLKDRRPDSLLLCTMSPCEHCAGLAINSRRVGRVVYRDEYRDPAGLSLLAAAGVVAEAWVRTRETVVVGERANSPARPDLDALGPVAWAAGTVSVPAFADPKSRAKLGKVGIDLATSRSLNLLPPAPREVPWDARKAKIVARLVDLSRFAVAYLAGAKVCAAFGVSYSPGLVVGRAGQTGLVAVPHPSGLCRFWNSPPDVKELRRCLSCHLG